MLILKYSIIHIEYLRMSTQNWGIPGGSGVKNLLAMQETRVQSRERLPSPIFLPGGFHGQRSLAGYSPWGPWGRKETGLSD